MSSAGVEKRGSAATVRACDSCRKRKRRCLWTPNSSSCTQCTQLKEECVTTYVRKQRSKPQKRDRIAEYEHRIQKLEALLKERSEAQPQVEEQPLVPADESIPLSTWVDNFRNEVDAFPPDQIPDLTPKSYEGSLQYTGQEPLSGQISNSNFTDSALGDASPQNLDDFEPSAEFQEDAALLQDASYPSFQVTTALSELSVTETSDAEKTAACTASLPPPELGASLLAEFLVDFNTVFPLYRPYAIAEHLRICYEGGSDGTALAWASAYVVLGIAHRARGMSAVATPQDNQLADWYLCRTLPTVSGLLVAPPTLGLVQCLLGLAMLVRSSSYSMPYGLFISTALRVAQSLAYDQDKTVSGDLTQDIEQQRRVFWLAFILDTDEAITSNSPTTHRRGDATAGLPAEDPHDSLGTVTAAEGTYKVNVFALRIHLVLLQAEAIEKVLSARAGQAAPQDLKAAAGASIERLRAWRNNELFQLSPDQLLQLLYRSDLIHVLAIEASYFATVFRIHAFLTLGMDPLVNPFSTDILTKLAAQTEHTAFADAERFLDLMSVVPHGDIGVCWMTKLPVIASLTTVLAHYLHTPSDPPASNKMREYSELLRTLGMLVDRGQDLELQRARDLCMMLFTKVETGLRVKWLHDLVDKSAPVASGTKPSA